MQVNLKESHLSGFYNNVIKFLRGEKYEKGFRLLMDIIYSFLISVITGLVSSITIFWILYMIKPRLDIAHEIMLDDKSNIIRIKVVNRSSFELVNVDYDLVCCNDKGDGVIETKRIEAVQKDFPVICKYNKNDIQARYAIRLAFDYTQIKNIFSQNAKNQFLLFRIKVSHRFSNGTLLKSMEYTKEQLIAGKYETGISCKVLR